MMYSKSKNRNIFFFALGAMIFLVALNGLYNSLMASFGLAFPYISFLFDPNDLFADFFNLILSLPGPQLTDTSEWPYYVSRYINNKEYSGLDGLAEGVNTHFHLPPLIMACLLILRNLFSIINPISVYFFLIFISLIYLFIYFKKRVCDKYLHILLIISCILSYPFLMLFTRGNFGALVTGFGLLVFLIAILENGSKYKICLALAVAISARPNCIIFVSLFLFFYDFKVAILQSIKTFAFALFITTISYLVAHELYGDYNLSTIEHGLKNYYNIYVIGNRGLMYGSSGYGFIKCFYLFLKLSVPSYIEIILLSYSVIFIAILYSFRKNFTHITITYQIICHYVLASSVFGDYHLIVFLGIITYMTMCYDKINFDKNQLLILFISIIILVPKNYIFYKGVSFQVIINPLLLFVSSWYLILPKLSKNLISLNPPK